VAKIMTSIIHNKVFTLCVKGAPKLDLKTHPSSPFQAMCPKKCSCAFPLSEKHLKPPGFEKRASRMGIFKEKV